MIHEDGELVHLAGSPTEDISKNSLFWSSKFQVYRHCNLDQIAPDQIRLEHSVLQHIVVGRIVLERIVSEHIALERKV